MGIAASLLLSAPGKSMPTGATMVLSASAIFLAAIAFSPRYGVLPRIVRLWEKRNRTAAENLLRTMYLMHENRKTDDRRFGVDDIAAVRHELPWFVRKMSRHAMSRGWLDRTSRDPLIFTDAGFAEAKRIVRNHRLWELFLTQQARLEADHVHADAEHLEHILPREVIAQLEQMLDSPQVDPHGKPIPV
jgi:manganese/zinc/iron transport system permease protein